jgi:hypothetical protein
MRGGCSAWERKVILQTGRRGFECRPRDWQAHIADLMARDSESILDLRANPGEVPPPHEHNIFPVAFDARLRNDRQQQGPEEGESKLDAQ